MEAVFLKILNMSITASWIVLAVIGLRLLMKRSPKWILVLLWGLVGVRLLCPVSLESVLSLIPSAETIPNDILYTETPAIHSGIAAVNSTVNPILSESLAPAVGAGVNPMQVVAYVASLVWLVGMAVMLVYMAVSFLRIRKRIREAVPFRENIRICDRVDTPFILGVLRPRIYLPSAMSEEDTEYVIAHERAHLKRRDHWWKPLGFLLLTVYWFNPLLWLAYVLLCRDIELACDEKVIRELGTDNKKPYSNALINCSAPRRMIAACPLAFGETNVKGRIRSVLNYKEPALWIIVIAVLVCVVVALCFLTDPAGRNNRDPELPESDELILLREQYPRYFGLDASKGLDVYVWQMGANSYSFGLLPHSKTPRDQLSTELLDLRGTSANEMRQILSAYGIDRRGVHIILWQNPLSSYLGDYWIISKDESPEEKHARAVAAVEDMLFGEQPATMVYGFPIYDTLIFDMDGDGIDEQCVLAYGMTSGLFTFHFTASEVGSELPKYSRIYSTIWYDLSFVRCEDGIVRVQGIDQALPAQTHLFDISVIDGVIHLTENGQEIEEITIFIPVQ